MDKIKIAVLMSTYNGERFLKEQLNSILLQKDIELSLLIRDDGSKDGTLDILQEYENRYSFVKVVKGVNVGFVQSFSNLVIKAIELFKDYQFFAFADQDDYWYPEKLFVSVNKLLEYDSNVPCLFTSNSRFIDQKGIGSENFHDDQYTNDEKAVFNSTEQGCSMVFNRTAAIIYAHNTPNIAWHDRWMYMICYHMGNVCYYKNALFDYRIHGSNVLGSRKKTIRKLLYDIFQPSPHWLMANEFYDRFNLDVQLQNCNILEKYICYRKSIIHKISFLYTVRLLYRNVNIYEKCKFLAKVIFGRL